jgi:hypothetical protein
VKTRQPASIALVIGALAGLGFYLVFPASTSVGEATIAFWPFTMLIGAAVTWGSTRAGRRWGRRGEIIGLCLGVILTIITLFVVHAAILLVVGFV